jgi:hypothetical protein
MRIKLFGRRFIFKIFFPPTRTIKWLPAIMWGWVGKAQVKDGSSAI